MAKKKGENKLLSQCSGCRAVQQQEDGHIFWNASIAIFSHVPASVCPSCAQKGMGTKQGIAGITKA